MSPELYPIAVAVCGITTLLSPFLIRWSDPIADRATAVLPGWVTRVGARYAAVVGRARGGVADAAGASGAPRRAGRVVIYAAWLLGLLVAGAYLSLWLAGDVTRALTLSDNVQRAAGLLFLGLFALPLAVAFTRATEDWGHEVARLRALDPNRLARPADAALGPRVLSRIAAGLASVALLAVAIRIAWGVHPLALPATWLTGFVLLVLAATAILMWKRLERAYHWMEDTLNVLLGHGEEEAQPLQRLRSRYPFGVDAEEIAILPHGWGAYTSLRDLALPERTGVTLISIERGGVLLASPHPDVALLPGDKVVIVGKRDQLDQAARLLHERWTPSGSTPVRPQAHEIRVPPSSPAVGATLGESGLRQATGVRVAAIERRGGGHVPPSPLERLQAGDRLTLFGTPEELGRARRHLGVRDEHAPRARDGPRGSHPLAVAKRDSDA